MRIPIEQILPDPDIYDQDKKGSRPGELRPESRPSGARRPPVVVKDTRGRVLYEAPPPARERVVSEQTAYLLSDILSDNEARAPGSEWVA